MRLRIAAQIILVALISYISIGATWQPSSSLGTTTTVRSSAPSHMTRSVHASAASFALPMRWTPHVPSTTTTTTTTTTIPPHPLPTIVTSTESFVTPPAVAPAPSSISSSAKGSTDSIWSCIIQHESGGDPSAVNPSSGAGGLFQFLPSSWAAYGGTQYASLPEYATVAQQWAIAVAAQSQSGWWPWKGDGCTPVG
mgnify:CR=1 FL=1